MKTKGKNRRREARSILVQNKDQTTPTQTLLKLTLNLLPSSCRMDSLEGQDYTVVPMVILTEGVHSGSMGRLLYPKSELSKTPAVWNHKPIVVYHPTMNGVGVSACDPVIINSRKVGLMMNTRFEGGKLKSEAWIRKDRAEQVDDRIMAAVDSGEMMELSTGVFVDVEEKDGSFGGEDYVGVATNYRPDHLALLPDQIGACSIADGAGFLRNAAKEKNVPESVMTRMLEKAGLSSNELSHSDIHVTLGGLLRDRFGSNEMNTWVMDVFSNFVVYERDGTLYRLGYTSNDSEVQLSDDTPVEVVRVSEYRTVQNTSNEEQEIMNPEIKKLVDIICDNAKWSEKDRETLGNIPKERLVTLAEMKKENPNFKFTLSEESKSVANSDGTPSVPTTEPAPTPEPSPEPSPAPTPAPTPVAAVLAANQRKLNLNEYIEAAPKDIQEVLINGIGIYNEEKENVVASILANEHNTFSEGELKGRPLGELRKMANLMGQKSTTQGHNRIPQYAGRGLTPTENTEKEECLEMPALNFDRK